jgi:hypothetical protein
MKNSIPKAGFLLNALFIFKSNFRSSHAKTDNDTQNQPNRDIAKRSTYTASQGDANFNPFRHNFLFSPFHFLISITSVGGRLISYTKFFEKPVRSPQ